MAAPRLRFVVPLAAFALNAAPSPTQQPPLPALTRTVLAVEIRISADGSQPPSRSGISNEAQRFTYLRTVSGTLALETKTDTTGAGADARQLLTFSARRTAPSQLVATAMDTSWQTFTDSGEGHVQETYIANEMWHAVAFPNAIDLRPVLVLDAAKQRWLLVDFSMDQILRQLREKVQYVGVATMTSMAERSWSHAAGREQDRTVDDKYITGGLQPGGFLPPLGVLLERIGVPAIVEKDHYGGRMELDLGPVLPPDIGRLRAVVSWSVREEVAEVELEIDSPGYLFWRPTAAPASADAERTHGNVLDLRARLVRKDPVVTARLPEIEEITWRLVDTSREPGIAMNFPYNSKDRRPDLELSGSGVRQSPLDDERQGVRHKKPLFWRSRVQLRSYDWGGFGKLEVEARLADGRTVKGHLRGRPELTSVPLPRPLRDGQRPFWMTPHADERDDRDDERDPPGREGAHGDGLSNYEEYRGFYVDGRHVAGDPRKKDLFVRVESEGKTVREALATFAGISGLRVHGTLRSDELPGGRAGRVINRNHGDGPHLVGQHALIVRTKDEVQRPVAYGKAPPRNVPLVAVPETLFGLAPSLRGLAPGIEGQDQRALLRHLTVQALFEAVGVDRPGRGDFTTCLTLLPPEPGGLPTIVAGSQRTPVLVLDEQGRDVAVARWREAQACAQRLREFGFGPAWSAILLEPDSWYWRIGVPGGEHSGPETCVMRDWFADAHGSQRAGAPVLIENGPPRERPGTTLGTQLEGTGINAPGRARYGDIRGSRPPANAQLVVNDRHQ
ncbi:MAG: hypothetical protein FJ265_13290 [Planctomycetes bacterium]|nr:hypothetical protein [Planctomycetota bacterium]